MNLVEHSAAIERVLVGGDLSQLTPEQRTLYYNKVCESIGVNPLTQPFSYIRLNGKEVLYATRACTEQLRTIHKVSLTITSREVMGDVYVVIAKAKMPDGREDESTGAVTIKGLAGDNLANAYLKAETKAKRRVTLSICGLGLLDETEVASIPNINHTKPPETIRAPTDIPDEPPHRNLPPGFIPPEVTPAMKARFEKTEDEEIKRQAEQLIVPESFRFEEPSPFAEEAVYVNGNTLLFFGKNKGKSFSEIGRKGLENSIWGAEKGLSEGLPWVDKVGVDNVTTFIKQAKAYIASGHHGI